MRFLTTTRKTTPPHHVSQCRFCDILKNNTGSDVMAQVIIKIDAVTKYDLRKKAQMDGWDISHLVRRLMELWLSKEINAGKPRPIRTKLQKKAMVFRVSDEVRIAFNTKAHQAGWRSAALIRQLLDLWYLNLISAGAPSKGTEIHTMMVDGKEIPYYTLDEASRIIGICALTLRKRIRRESLSIQGRRLKITQEEIEALRPLFAK